MSTSRPSDPLVLREATAADAPAIAALHADSWQRHYRGAYPDHFLDHEVHDDRAAVWHERLTTRDPNAVTILAERDDTLIGFSHVVFDDDPTWGSLLDNLHVTFALKRSGVGTQLLAESAKHVLRHDPNGLLHLWVLEQNTAGQAFYAALGGEIVERKDRAPNPGYGLRCVWRDPSILILNSKTTG